MTGHITSSRCWTAEFSVYTVQCAEVGGETRAESMMGRGIADLSRLPRLARVAPGCGDAVLQRTQPQRAAQLGPAAGYAGDGAGAPLQPEAQQGREVARLQLLQVLPTAPVGLLKRRCFRALACCHCHAQAMLSRSCLT